MLVFIPAGHGQSTHPETVITAADAEVRSGPSMKFYPTTRLRQGDAVRVVEEKEGGWLAIEPPRGSFSWINARLIEQHGQLATVLAPEAVLLAGSELSNQEPDVQSTKLQRGAVVVLLSNRPAYNKDGSWLPIQCAPREVRYVPAGAVRSMAPVQSVSSAPPPAAAAPTALTPPAAATGVNPLWAQAEQAESAGNYTDAIRLYDELGRQSANSDHDLSMRCFNRSQYLRQNYLGRPPGGYATAQPAGQAYSPPYTPPTAPAAPAAAAPAAPRVTSQYTYTPDQPQRPAAPAPAATPAPAPVSYYNPRPPQPVYPSAQWSGAGQLRRTPLTVDNKPTYCLESQGLPRLYVTAQPGVNLDLYLNRQVMLYGPMVYRGDVKTNYMTVSQVAPAN
jgi:hypothetical protein